MDSGNNSSSLQSSSGGDEEFDSRTFFTTNSSPATNTNKNRNISICSTNNNHLHHQQLPFFDSMSFLDPSSSFPLLSPTIPPRAQPENPTHNPLSNPPTKTPAPTTAPRNPKKRSRASRRAPTTVLTTDTSNFRAMVQEFTGIPAPPFSSSSSSSSYPRSRFDFFNPSINASGSSSPSFLLKPYPHKFQIPNINASSTTTNNNNTTAMTSPTSFNYQLPSSSNLGLSNNDQGPILNFQSLLQSQLANSTANLGAKTQQTNSLMMPSTSSAASEYGVNDLGLPGLIGSGWGQDAAGDPTQLRQVMGGTTANYGMSSKVNNSCKLNFSAPGSTEFSAEKGGEARGEGMLEPWICSSD